MDIAQINLTFNRAAAIHSHGLPDARMARLAARKAFVEMKQYFIRAAADIPGSAGAQLQHQIRQSSEITDLWRLRVALFTALPQDSMLGDMHRQELRYQLDCAFSDGGVELGLNSA